VKKIVVCLLLGVFLSGCATYKFQPGPKPMDNGYMVSYKGTLIPEYTLGPDKKFPDMALAKERFNRRHGKVEYYYKKMGRIQSSFQANIAQPVTIFVDFIGGVFYWPFMAVSDYRYNHNPAYKEKLDKRDEQNEALEQAKIDDLKIKLNAYVQQDLVKEDPAYVIPAAPTVAAAAVAVSAEPAVAAVPVSLPAPEVISSSTQPVLETQVPAKTQSSETLQTNADTQPAANTQVVEKIQVPEAKEPPAEPVLESKVIPAIEYAAPTAVIIARPQKGFSPLMVKFSAGKSRSPNGKIVSYNWDFGDGDSATLKNVSNTYWSTSYGSRNFTATLTVKDDKGATATASTLIEVSTK
jgi:hypothetical protein